MPPSHSATVPHILHFTVPKVTSDQQEGLIRTAAELHPHWEIKVWRDPVSPSGFRLKDLWKHANSGAQLADLIRLDVVYRYGGVYLDSDVRVFRNFGEVADRAAMFICSEDGRSATNAVFGARPRHPAIGALIDDLLRSPPDWDVAPNLTTGPRFFTRVLKWRDDIVVLPREALYPYNWNERLKAPHPQSLAVHLWAGSWKRGPRGFGLIRLHAETWNPRKLAGKLLRSARHVIGCNERWVRHRAGRAEGFSATGELIRKTVHGYKIVLSGADISITPQVYCSGYYELREELFVKRILRGGDYFIDVGANMGTFSLLAAQRVGPFGRVFSYEPNPAVAMLLRKSAVMNRMHERIVIRSVAVGHVATELKLGVVPSFLGGAGLRTDAQDRGTAAEAREYIGGAEEVNVSVVRLDDEFPFNIPIRALKIDAKGFEANVLAGAERLLRSHSIDYVIFQAAQEVSGGGWEALFAALEGLMSFRYRPFRFVRNGLIAPTTLARIRLLGGDDSRSVVFKRHGI